MVNKGIIGIRNRKLYNNKLRLHLHYFEKADSQFFVRYVIAFELSDKEKWAEWLQHKDNGEYNDCFIILQAGEHHIKLI